MNKTIILGGLLLLVLSTAQALTPSTLVVLYNNAGTKINTNVSIKQTQNNIEHVFGCKYVSANKILGKYYTTYNCLGVDIKKPATTLIQLSTGYIEKTFNPISVLRQINTDKETIKNTITRMGVFVSVYNETMIVNLLDTTWNLKCLDNGRLINVTDVNTLKTMIVNNNKVFNIKDAIKAIISVAGPNGCTSASYNLTVLNS